MIDSDSNFQQFKEIWITAHELSASNATPSQSAVNMVYSDLINFELNDIAQALAIHRKNSRFAPTVADVYEILGVTTSKHKSADQAWAIALPMMGDEDGSFLVTREILEAKALAEPVYLAGDKFGAARAFKDRYAELMKEADGVSPRWFVSLGDNRAKRIDAANEARRLGLISSEAQDTLLLGNEPVEKNNDFLARIAEVKKDIFSNLSVEKSPEMMKKEDKGNAGRYSEIL